MENSYKYFLEDCLLELIDRSKKIKNEADSTKNPFDEGMSFAYYEILNFLLNQAEVFEIKDDLKPEIKNYSPSF